ncbi:mitochondrial import receptor subunit TOM70 [Nilaparvata lugens]|uniref:mitochondrial import receptor subunit TOM70 n=1 Tax=Nilaparvata lugens TaxID=108931 RepID=UPI00193CC3FA|nr:mitochondrial import receptor subunit TOM70 [Nilaparvata lugens]
MDTERSSLIKWSIVIGTPVVAVAGYWYYVNKYSIVDDSKKKGGAKSTSTVSTSPTTPVVIENEIEEKPAKKLSPLERAISLKNSGNALFRERKYEDAIKCYTEAIDVCPENDTANLATFYQNRAAAYEQIRNFEGVVADCTKALSYDPKYVKAFNRRAKAHEQLDNLKSSLEDVTACCILEQFQNQNSMTAADRILTKLGKKLAQEALPNKRPAKLSKHVVKRYFCAFSNDPIMNSLNNDEPDYLIYAVEEQQLRGLAKAKRLFQKEMFDEVLDACTEELKISAPTSKTAHEALLFRGTMYFLVGNQNKSLEDFTTIIDGNCNDVKIKVNALIKRAAIHVQIETPDLLSALEINNKRCDTLPQKCLADFSEAETLDPNNSDVYHHRGQVYLLMERMEEARECFQKSLQKTPGFPIVKAQLYYVDYKLAADRGDMASISRSIEGLTQVMRERPDCVEAHNILIQVCNSQRDFSRAGDLYEKLIKDHPDNTTARVQRALFHLQVHGDVEKAIKFIEEAIELDENLELAYETLAQIEIQRCNLNRAMELFNKGLELAKNEREMAHLYSLRAAADAQTVVARRLGLDVLLRQ